MTIANGMRNATVAFALMLPGLAGAAPSVPLADFFRYPAASQAIMSPSGRYVAATMKGGAKGRLGLVMIDLTAAGQSRALALYADADVVSVRWVNDDRLIFSVVDFQSPAGEQIGGGLFAVDREGKEQPRNLIRRQFSTDEVGGVVAVSGTRLTEAGLSIFHRFHSVVRDGSNDIIVQRVDRDDRYQVRGYSLLRLDTVNGKTRILTQGGPDFVHTWALDRNGTLRAGISHFEGKSRLYWKASADAPWSKVSEWATYGDTRDHINLVAVEGTSMLYVAGRRGKDSDKEVLSRIDMSRPNIEWTPLVELDGYDFFGWLVFGRNNAVVGVHFLTDARGTHWFDATLKGMQARIDKALPGRINEISCGDCIDPQRLLVRSWSDRQPAIMYIFDANAGTLSVLTESRPWLKAQAMSGREMRRVVARDGLSIPVHVTRPTGQKGPAPMVVLVHGGPYVRGGEWAWDANSQFLASRGYVVLEPEFRGSAGFGFKHFRAGWKQWGLAMQDDIADATRWAIEQGIADPGRICIAGASYGGYATLMGLIRYPDLYRCGVNWVGVTDLDLLFTSRWSDFSDLWREYGMPVLVGDRDKDAAQFAATSPVKQAAKLTQPLLMAYGGDDRRVPMVHGITLRSAVASHNKNLEWVTYPDEGHGWMLEANTFDFWTRVEKFLDKNLKQAN
ncbi:MAG: S9 family peptidase [Betaproteobacteria bacterium]|nr:S9 family peptidase [Betaproteobacteria bacterium]